MQAWLVRYRGYLFLSLIFVVSTSALVFVARRTDPKPIQISTPAPRPTVVPVPTATPANIVAQVSGAVNAPGLVYLSAGARVDDAVKAAGGATNEADLSRLNLARRVSDGELIVVPRLGDPTAAPAGTARERSTATPTILAQVNINTASLGELDRLPGIGPAIAQRIIDYRNANGPFQRIEDIIKVRGIGQAEFDAIQHLIVVR